MSIKSKASFGFSLLLPTLLLLPSISLMAAEPNLGGAKSQTAIEEGQSPFGNSRTQFRIKRYITDAQKINADLIYSGKGQAWNIFEFKPLFPGHIVIEQLADVDKKTNSATIVPGSDTVPLFEGKFEVVSSFGRALEVEKGEYRLSAPPVLSSLRASGRPTTMYELVNPLLVGGFAVGCKNTPTKKFDDKEFSPVFSIPPEWVQTITRNTDLPESPSLKSANPLVVFEAAKKILMAPNSPENKEGMTTLLQVASTESRLKKAVLVSLIINEQNSHPPLTKESDLKLDEARAISLIKSASNEDLGFLLLSLQNIGTSATHDFFTKEPIPGLGAALLGAIAAKVKALPVEAPNKKSLEALLKSFQIGPREGDLPQNPESEESTQPLYQVPKPK